MRTAKRETIDWEIGSEANQIIRQAYQSNFRSRIIDFAAILYIGISIILPSDLSLFSTDSIPTHITIATFFLLAHIYFGSRKFASNKITIALGDKISVAQNGWWSTTSKIRIIHELQKESVVELDGSLIRYISVPNTVLSVLKNLPSIKTTDVAKVQPKRMRSLYKFIIYASIYCITNATQSYCATKYIMAHELHQYSSPANGLSVLLKIETKGNEIRHCQWPLGPCITYNFITKVVQYEE